MNHCDEKHRSPNRNMPEPLTFRGTDAKEFPILSAPPHTAVDFRSLLLAELEYAGLIPDAEHVVACRRDVSRIGYEEAATLADLVGATLWVQALAQLGRPYPHADCERVLGFGSMLTAFMLPPVRIDEALSHEVCSLGGHANLLVSLFDQVADECSGGALPLSPATVDSACAGRGRAGLTWRSHTGPPIARLLTRLLSAYVRRLDRLPYSRRHRSLRALQTRTIVAMHAAELQTLPLASGVSSRAIRRKSALPFVVMGMPAWLTVEHVPPATFRAHLRWLYRVGSFFGYIDDAADLDADRAAGRPNRVAASLARDAGGSPCDGDKRLARSIASEGTRIMAERRAASTSRPAFAADDVLTTAVLSWLDAIPR
jgi:hypothetical protein